jgi:hypothetical protein
MHSATVQNTAVKNRNLMGCEFRSNMSVTRTPSENEKNKEVITVSVMRRPSGSSELVVLELFMFLFVA